jgi:hypothetical protein
LTPLMEDEMQRAEEMDHLWSRIEQMQQSLQESNDRAATAEKKAAELAEALRKGRQLIKSLQSAVVTQQRSKLTSSRTRDRSKHQDIGVAGPSTVKAQSCVDNAHQLSVQITQSYVSLIIICVIQRHESLVTYRDFGTYPNPDFARDNYTAKAHTAYNALSRRVSTSQPATNPYVQSPYAPVQSIPMQPPPLPTPYSYESAHVFNAPVPPVQTRQFMHPSFYAPAPLTQVHTTMQLPAPVNIQSSSIGADPGMSTLQGVNSAEHEMAYQMWMMQRHTYQELLNRAVAPPPL